MYYKGGDRMTLTVRVNETELNMIKSYAVLHGITISELLRDSVLERIEDEYDLQTYERAIAEYKANPVSRDFMEVAKELDLL